MKKYLLVRVNKYKKIENPFVEDWFSNIELAASYKAYCEALASNAILNDFYWDIYTVDTGEK